MDDQKLRQAFSYVPVLLSQLDGDGREMLGVVMQAQRDAGYEDGFNDGRFSEMSTADREEELEKTEVA
jgi:hypothetical protein